MQIRFDSAASGAQVLADATLMACADVANATAGTQIYFKLNIVECSKNNFNFVIFISNWLCASK